MSKVNFLKMDKLRRTQSGNKGIILKATIQASSAMCRPSIRKRCKNLIHYLSPSLRWLFLIDVSVKNNHHTKKTQSRRN
jgi:hypothetical protein